MDGTDHMGLFQILLCKPFVLAELLEGRDRIGTANELICKEHIYLSHRKYKGEHTHLPTSRGNGMLN